MSRYISYLEEPISSAPLGVFRALFGAVMLFSIIRFAAYGWIEKMYVEPTFFFKYFGWEWVQPLGNYTYILFALCGVSALGVMLGFKYRISIVIFFLAFTYIELIDKTYYLNHYYLVTSLSFLMIWMPAERSFSLDSLRIKVSNLIPRWTIASIMLLIGIVYFYAGLAKLNTDWIIEAMPLKMWLPNKSHLPIIGSLLEEEWIIYAFSYGGLIYDLSIVFLLMCPRTRRFAFMMVVVFHIITWYLFPIGVFPWVMIASSTIFFSGKSHQKFIDYVYRTFSVKTESLNDGRYLFKWPLLTRWIVCGFLCFHIIFPFRHLMYPGELFWTEEGYRFSWRVMLMEKAGTAQFSLVDRDKEAKISVDNRDYLTPLQEKHMATQPDFILQYAHYLVEQYKRKGMVNPEVYVDSYVALNGRRSTRFINQEVNLAEIRDSWKHKDWILPFTGNIKGF